MVEKTIQNRPNSNSSQISPVLLECIEEVDELNEVATGASLEIIQLVPGRFQGCFSHIQFPDSSLHQNQINLPSRGRGVASATRWSFIMFSSRGKGTFNAFSLDPGILIAYPPNSEFEGTIMGEAVFCDWVLTVTEDALADVYFALAGRDLTILKSHVKCLKPALSTIKLLQDFVIDLLLAAQRRPEVFNDRMIRQRLQRQLIEWLARTLMSADHKLRYEVPPHSSHWQLVRSVESFLDTNLARDLSLAELCSAAGVSERTLRRAFDNVLGVGPLQYLKAFRLNRAHCELKQAASNKNSVAKVAMHWGLKHLGRFSQEYRHFFGEMPSDTLRRNKT